MVYPINLRKIFQTKILPGWSTCCLLVLLSASSSRAQVSTGQDMQQLLYDIEKLTQFKAILSDMQQGYTILSQGYQQVRDLAQGNLKLHTAFLDGLLQVNPEVARYARVADMMADAASVLQEYQQASRRFRQSKGFDPDELAYLARVYSQLTGKALQQLSELADILTAAKLRMSDDERLSAIDRIYTEGHEQLTFLRDFNRRTNILLLQRQREQQAIAHLKTLYP